MSCCGGNCSCGSGCGGRKMYLDLEENNITSQTTTLIMGVAPTKAYGVEGLREMGEGAENGCKCGSNCTCDPCRCK